MATSGLKTQLRNGELLWGWGGWVVITRLQKSSPVSTPTLLKWIVCRRSLWPRGAPSTTSISLALFLDLLFFFFFFWGDGGITIRTKIPTKTKKQLSLRQTKTQSYIKKNKNSPSNYTRGWRAIYKRTIILLRMDPASRFRKAKFLFSHSVKNS